MDHNRFIEDPAYPELNLNRNSLNMTLYLNENGEFNILIEECPMEAILDYLNTYYTPVIILCGLLGNFLSFAVFLTTHLKMRSSSYYLAALAAADFGFLTILLLVYLSNINVIELYNKPGWCQTMVYISGVCALLSVWLMVAFTVERFIAVQYPLQRPHMCTVSRAKAIIFGLVVVALASQSYTFVTTGVVKGSGLEHDQCEILNEHFFAMKIINIIDTIMTLIAPFILIVVMNTMISRSLFMFRCRFQHGSLDECLSNDRSDVNLHQMQQSGNGSSTRRPASQNSQNSTIRLPTASRRSQSSSDQLPRCCIHSGRTYLTTRNQQNITKMLLLISSVFILLTLPSYFIRLYSFFFYSLWEEEGPATLWCMQQFAMLLYYTNFSINFLLYAMCGITFRRCLWKLMRKNLKTFTRYCTTPRQSP